MRSARDSSEVEVIMALENETLVCYGYGFMCFVQFWNKYFNSFWFIIPTYLCQKRGKDTVKSVHRCVILTIYFFLHLTTLVLYE